MMAGGPLNRLVCSDDFHREARRRLPYYLAEYFDGVSFDGETARRNRSDLLAAALPQNVIRDVAGGSTCTSLLGEGLAMPLALSPVGLAGMAWPRGEAVAAHAAGDAGIPFGLSTTSICPLDEVTRVSPPWLQLYLIRDRDFVAMMLAWAQEQGCRTLLLTVDLPVLGPRWGDMRSGLSQPGIRGQFRRSAQMARVPRWTFGVGLHGRPHTFGNVARHLAAGADLASCIRYIGGNMEMALGPETVRWIRDRWPHRLIVKGVLNPQDALIARDCGADAVLVSNHGGRQLDGVRSSISALPGIRAAVGPAYPLLMDGGIRSGLDIAKAILAGADIAMIGRPWVWALAAGGQQGIARLLSLMTDELRIAMALCGVRSITELKALGRDTSMRITPGA